MSGIQPLDWCGIKSLGLSFEDLCPPRVQDVWAHEKMAETLLVEMRSFGNQLNGSLRDVYQIAFKLLYVEVSAYLSYLIDHRKSEALGISMLGSEHLYFFRCIQEDRVVKEVPAFRLERARKKHDRLKKRVAHFLPYFRRRHEMLVQSSNDLSRQYISGQNAVTYPIHHLFPMNLAERNDGFELAKDYVSHLESWFPREWFHLRDSEKQSLSQLAKMILCRVLNDMDQAAHRKLFPSQSRRLVTGTGGGYHARLLSYLARDKGLKVLRFSHGGERHFFLDDFFFEVEMFAAQEYFTHSAKEAEEFQRRSAKKNMPEMSFQSLGADYQRSLSGHAKEPSKGTKRVMYISSSYTGPARQFPKARMEDVLYAFWQRQVIGSLRDRGFHLIYKKHPKGFYQNENTLGSYCDQEIAAPMKQALDQADVFICDQVGSATVEAICTGKKVILFDFGQRPWNPRYREDFSKMVTIFPVSWSEGVPEFEFQRLIDELQEPAFSPRWDLIEDYFYSR